MIDIEIQISISERSSTVHIDVNGAADSATYLGLKGSFLNRHLAGQLLSFLLQIQIILPTRLERCIVTIASLYQWLVTIENQFVANFSLL